MRLGFARRRIQVRATAIAAVLGLVVTGSGQAFQAEACPSHDDSRVGARQIQQATPSSAAHQEVHGHTAEAPETEHGNHACTCFGDCCQTATAKGVAAEGQTRRLSFRVPLAVAITGMRLPATAQAAFVLTFATAPPSST